MKRFSRAHRYQLESLESRRLLAAYTVDLGMLPGGVDLTDVVDGVRAAEAAVGMTSSSSGYRAFLVTPEDTDGNGAPDRWFRDSNSDGKNDLMRDLGTIGANYNYGWANDVNNLGQVVGRIMTSWPAPPSARAFLWQDGVMTDMGASYNEAYAINDAGQITGLAPSGFFLWKAGGATMGVGGTDINAAGQLIDDSRVWTPTVPNGTTGTFATLGQLPPVWDYPEVWIELSPKSINGAGHVVGYQTDYFYGETSTGIVNRGVRWIDGIPELLPLEFASAINDTGQIVGSRDGRAYLLANENFGTAKTWIGPASSGNWSTASNWSPSGVPTASNHVYISGKSVNLAASATLASLSLTEGSTLTFTDPGNSVLRVSSLSMSSDSKLDLTDNGLIVDYNGASPLTQVRDLIVAGRNGGTWNGPGITSSAATAFAGTGLGFGEATHLFNSFPASFLGQSVDETSILVRYTQLGDANLDRSVDVADLGVLASNWQQSPRTFNQGDFSYDGKVDVADLGILASNWQVNMNGPSSPAQSPSQSRFADPSQAPVRRRGVIDQFASQLLSGELDR